MDFYYKTVGVPGYEETDADIERRMTSYVVHICLQIIINSTLNRNYHSYVSNAYACGTHHL
jgi:hypothetical protein